MGRSSSSPPPPPPQHKQHNHRRPFRGDHYHHHHHPGTGTRDRSPSSIQFHGATEIHGGARDQMNHHHHKARKISNTSSIRGHGNGYSNHNHHHHHHHHHHAARNYHGQYNTTSTGRGRTPQISLHHRETNPSPSPNFNPNPNPSSRSSNSNSSCNTAAPPFAASVAMAGGMNDGRPNPPPPPRDHRTITSVCYSANSNEPDPSSLPIQGEEAMKGKDLGGVPPRSGAGAEGNPRQRRYQELFSLHQDLQQRNNNNESLEMSKRKQEAWELACALAHAYVFQGDYSSSSSSSRSPRPPPMLHNTTMNHLVDVENKKEEAPLQPRVSSREEAGEQDLTAPSSSSIQISCMNKKAAVVVAEGETHQTTSREEEMEEPSSLVSEERKRGDDSSSPTDAPSMEGLEEERSHLPSSLHDLNTSSAQVHMKKPWPSMRPLHYIHPCGKLPEEEKPEASSSSPSLPDSSSKSSAPDKNIGSKKNIGANMDIGSKKNFGSKPDEGTITSKPNPRPVFIDLNIDLNVIPPEEAAAAEDVKNCDVKNNSEPLNPLYTATMGPTSRRRHHHDQFASPSIIDLNAAPPTEDDWADGCDTTNGSLADRCETIMTDRPRDKCETADCCEIMADRLSGKECEMMDLHGGLKPPHEESGEEEEEEEEEEEDMGEEELVCIEEVVNPTQAAEWFGTHFPSPAALVS